MPDLGWPLAAAGWTVVVLPLLPLFANSFGWIFTEMGRQPWVVFGLMPHRGRVSRRHVSAGPGAATSLIGFTLLYGALAVVEVKLLLRYDRQGLPERRSARDPDDDPTRPLAFAY